METAVSETLKERVEALDHKILAGEILEAVQIFFDDEIVTQEGNADHLIRGKEAKLDHLRGFFDEIAGVNAIQLHSQAVGDGVTMSEFTFDLTQTDGSRILWNEVLRRKWRDGLVVDERYYTA